MEAQELGTIIKTVCFDSDDGDASVIHAYSNEHTMEEEFDELSFDRKRARSIAKECAVQAGISDGDDKLGGLQVLAPIQAAVLRELAEKRGFAVNT